MPQQQNGREPLKEKSKLRKKQAVSIQGTPAAATTVAAVTTAVATSPHPQQECRDGVDQPVQHQQREQRQQGEQHKDDEQHQQGEQRQQGEQHKDDEQRKDDKDDKGEEGDEGDKGEEGDEGDKGEEGDESEKSDESDESEKSDESDESEKSDESDESDEGDESEESEEGGNLLQKFLKEGAARRKAEKDAKRLAEELERAKRRNGDMEKRIKKLEKEKRRDAVAESSSSRVLGGPTTRATGAAASHSMCDDYPDGGYGYAYEVKNTGRFNILVARRDIRSREVIGDYTMKGAWLTKGVSFQDWLMEREYGSPAEQERRAAEIERDIRTRGELHNRVMRAWGRSIPLDERSALDEVEDSHRGNVGYVCGQVSWGTDYVTFHNLVIALRDIKKGEELKNKIY